MRCDSRDPTEEEALSSLHDSLFMLAGLGRTFWGRFAPGVPPWSTLPGDEVGSGKSCWCASKRRRPTRSGSSSMGDGRRGYRRWPLVCCAWVFVCSKVCDSFLLGELAAGARRGGRTKLSADFIRGGGMGGLVNEARATWEPIAVLSTSPTVALILLVEIPNIFFYPLLPGNDLSAGRGRVEIRQESFRHSPLGDGWVLFVG